MAVPVEIDAPRGLDSTTWNHSSGSAPVSRFTGAHQEWLEGALEDLDLPGEDGRHVEADLTWPQR